ncbi:MAG: ABC transporter ATP-binding protein [Bacteroidales bacterium]|nr:ABC transporter ATP-binding protein [Bacteroidales bacterium]
MIQLEDIQKSFNSTIVLNDINLSIHSNTIVTIIGKSGCGKTTLLNIIAGIYEPTKGEIRIHKNREEAVVYLTQKPTLLSYRTAYENALLGVEIRNSIDSNTIVTRQELFNLFGLSDAETKYPNELSGGMKQRVGVIQSILIESDIYLLDEPFNAIDRNTLRKVEKKLWERFKEKNSSVVLVTHDIEQAILMSDRILMLSSNPGNIVYDLNFSDEFSKLEPGKRKDTPEFNEYLIDIVKKIGTL